MGYRRFVPLLCVALFLSNDAAARVYPEPARDSQCTASSFSPALKLAARKRIDKSCLMVCEEWGDDGCLKWVMKCKGDSGYPGPSTLSQ